MSWLVFAVLAFGTFIVLIVSVAIVLLIHGRR
jgi:hypothetical protein